MLQITTSDCKYLSAISDTINDVINNISNYSSIAISIKKNCCSAIFTDSITLTATPNQYTSQVIGPGLWPSGILVWDITFKNTVTGVTFKIPAYTQGSPLTVATIVNLPDLTNAIQTYLVTLYPSVTVSATTITDSTSGGNPDSFTYTISGLPSDIAIVSMETQLASAGTHPVILNTFSRNTSANGTSLTGEGLQIVHNLG